MVLFQFTLRLNIIQEKKRPAMLKVLTKNRD